MKTATNIFAIVLLVFGGIWFLQGIGILPGSFMTGQRQWAIIGCIMIAAGIIALIWASKRRR